MSAVFKILYNSYAFPLHRIFFYSENTHIAMQIPCREVQPISDTNRRAHEGSVGRASDSRGKEVDFSGSFLLSHKDIASGVLTQISRISSFSKYQSVSCPLITFMSHRILFMYRKKINIKTSIT